MREIIGLIKGKSRNVEENVELRLGKYIRIWSVGNKEPFKGFNSGLT